MTSSLDGLTILRFTKAYKQGAGIEEHLTSLDSELLTRNSLKIIRMFLEDNPINIETTAQEVGRGSLISVPMHITQGTTNNSAHKASCAKLAYYFAKKTVRELVIYNPILYHTAFRAVLKACYRPRPGPLRILNAGNKVRELHRKYAVDLILLHHLGSGDCWEVIQEAIRLGIPCAFVNHFSNDTLSSFSVREQINEVAGVAGVTGIGVPRWLKNRFYYVGNGVDLNFYDPVKASLAGIRTDIPIVILPARITPIKGQADLIKAYGKLRIEGLRAKIVLIGRIESGEYEKELRKLANDNHVADDVQFVGQLQKERLRDWYAASSVMAFPTYHQEGLPRILMESQAMKVPPVAYIIGGVSEGVIDGKTGFLVRKGDIKTFTEKVRELLTNEELRRKMGEEGRKFVKKRFSLEALAERHERFYLSVLGRRRNGR